MISRGVKVRLAAFLALGAVGIVYVTANYLGFIDRLLDRQLQFSVTLPRSAGLFVGSEVTNRGVKVGKIERMRVIPKGVRVDVNLKEGSKVPLSSPVYVHNLSAVGEQYLDFEPTSKAGPYAEDGDVIKGDASSLPVDEDDLLIQLDELVDSLDKNDLRTTVEETGKFFQGTGRPLQRLIDSGNVFVQEAQANQPATIQLLDSGLVVLRTQQAQGDNIKSFARDLADVTGALRASDRDVRTLLDEGPPAARELNTLFRQLEPTLPMMLANLVSVQQVVTPRLSAVEQLLVTFPRMIASGFTGTPGDGFGHINLQLGADAPQPCRRGYLDSDQWRSGDDLTDREPYAQARCDEGPPVNLRGSKYAPSFPPVGGSSNRVAPDDTTAQDDSASDSTSGSVSDGASDSAADAFGGDASSDQAGVTIGGLGGETTVFGGDSWKWMLVGPVSDQAQAGAQ